VSPLPAVGAFLAFGRAGFRRYTAYPAASVAASVLGAVFGLLHCSVLLAALGDRGSVAGYSAGQLASQAWIGQCLLRIVWLFGWTELSERVRTGAITAELLRPVDPLVAGLATDLGRALHALVYVCALPLVIGALFFPLAVPVTPGPWLLFAASVVLAVVTSYAVRHLMNLAAFWLLDARGPNVVWMVGATVLSGMGVPVHFFPPAVEFVVWLTPFPWMVQAPVDIVMGRGGTAHGAVLLAGQLVAATAAVGLCHVVQRAFRRLVLQGG
jgi:ABC-2 type transport system permease protein